MSDLRDSRPLVPSTRGLYALVDVDSLGPTHLSPVQVARAILRARPVALQLRAKTASARETLELLRAIQPECARAEVPFFANDRPDLAFLAACTGVHVGQGDLPLAEIRRAFPGLSVGVSTHDPAQLSAALALDPDYVAYGPVFATASKQRPDATVGLEALRLACRAARSRGVPLVAIGGINVERAPAIRDAGAIGAVIGALAQGANGESGVAERSLLLHRTLGGGALP